MAELYSDARRAGEKADSRFRPMNPSVYGIATIFFTVVKTFFLSGAMVLEADKFFCGMATMVFVVAKILLEAESILHGSETVVFGIRNVFSVIETIFTVVETTVGELPTTVKKG